MSKLSMFEVAVSYGCLSGPFDLIFVSFIFSFIFFFEMTPVVSSGLQKTVEDRIAIYKAAILNAKEAGENAKVRRYERGLKVWWIID